MKRGAGSNLGAEVAVDGGRGGWGPADTGGEYATRRPGEEEGATRVRSRRAEQACPRARRAAAQRESEGRPPRQGTRGRRAIRISTTAPLAPSLGDQVVNHVIVVVGHVDGRVARTRREAYDRSATSLPPFGARSGRSRVPSRQCSVPRSSRGLRPPPDRQSPRRRRPPASCSAARFLLELAQCH